MNLQEVVDELNSLDPQNPGAWPGWVRIAAVILASILIMVLGFIFAIKPVLEELSRDQAQEGVLFDEFQTKQTKVAALDAYKDQLKEMERSFGAMLRQLPSRAEVANLLNDISQTRVAASLEEELFKPQSDIPRDFYAEMPNDISVVGDYHQMGSFVSGVAALPRIVTIEDVTIKPLTGKDAINKNSIGTPLRMTAKAKTYRYLDDEEQQAQVAKAGKGKKGAKGKEGAKGKGAPKKDDKAAPPPPAGDKK